MLRVLITTHVADGHVAPLLPVAAHLDKEGHRVRFLAGEKYREPVTATGAREKRGENLYQARRSPVPRNFRCPRN